MMWRRIGKYGIFGVVAMLWCLHVHCQEEAEEWMSSWLEGQSMMEEMGENALDEELELMEYKQVQLNSVTLQELRQFTFLSPMQASAILAYRAQNGPFLSPLELQAVDGLDTKTIQMLMPFVYTQSVSTWQTLKDGDKGLNYAKHDVMLRFGRRLEQTRGYLPNAEGIKPYLGNPDRYVVRYRMRWQDQISFALNMKKDPGEAFFGRNQPTGFDHYGFSFQLKQKGLLSQLVLGDFGLQWGQGLQMWIAPAFGKGAIIHGPIRTGQTLVPYTSTRESGYLRGLASQWGKGSWQWTPFIAYQNLDATIEEGTDGRLLATSISTSGLHRTSNERQKKDRLPQWLFGNHVSYQKESSQVGIGYFEQHFAYRFSPEDNLRNTFSRRAKDFRYLSIHGYQQWSNHFLFGEFSQQLQAGHAWTLGLMSAWGKSFSSLLIWRDLNPRHQAIYAQAMAENQGATNEKGVYSGFSFQWNRYSEWVFYMDLFQFPWLKYRVDAPSRGGEVFTQFNYRWKKKGQISVRLRWKRNEQNRLDHEGYRELVDLEKWQFRTDIHYTPHEIWQWRFRFSTHFFKEPNLLARAYMGYVDMFYKPQARKLSGNLRMAYFHSPHFETRFYNYESDVLYGNSMPVYNQTGLRSYVNLRWKVLRELDFWIKYGVFFYPQVTSLGTGNELYKGSIKSELKMQCRLLF